MGYNNYKRTDNTFTLLKSIQFELENKDKISQRLCNNINFLTNADNFSICFLTSPLLYPNDKTGYYTFNCTPIQFTGDVEKKFNKMKSRGKEVFIYDGFIFERNRYSLCELLFKQKYSLSKIELLNSIKCYFVDNLYSLDDDVRIL